MKNLVKNLWADEAGVVVSTEIILVVLLLVLGLIAGMASLRDQAVQELGDLGEAINHLDASYRFAAPSYASESTGAQSGGPATAYNDGTDESNTQTADAAPEGIDMDGHDDTFGAAGEDGADI